MKNFRNQFLGLFILLCGALSLQGMLTPSLRLAKIMQQKKQQLEFKQSYKCRQQTRDYDDMPGQQGSSLWGRVKSFVESNSLMSNNQQPFMKKEEGIITRCDEMFALTKKFMKKELDVAEKDKTHLMFKGLSYILHELSAYKDILNQEKDGHTILGEIISFYGSYLKMDMNEATLLRSLSLLRTDSALIFFREVKKLGASNMTPGDFKRIEKVKDEFISLFTVQYSGMEELVPGMTILHIANAFRELKGENFFCCTDGEWKGNWMICHEHAGLNYVFLFGSLVDFELSYRRGEFFWIKKANDCIYNEFKQLIKNDAASIFGLKSEFYQKLVDRLQEMPFYADDKINEIKNMQDEMRGNERLYAVYKGLIKKRRPNIKRDKIKIQSSKE